MKKSDQDRTPIRFEIPKGLDAIQFGGAPKPVNQPKWKYIFSGFSKPRVLSWLGIIAFMVLSLSMIVLSILEDPVFIIPLMAGLVFLATSLWMLRELIIHIINSNPQKDVNAGKKPKKEYPRRRKDYRS